MSKYTQVVPGSSKQSLQHMISKSHWRDDLILNQIQKDVTKLIGNEVKRRRRTHAQQAAGYCVLKSMKLKEPIYLRELRDCESLPTDIALGLWNW
ncbi:MAG: hypothetical protein NTX42_08540 [Methanothrix sp.]|nr:hypothetical protein [Methanothrix sp.]